MIESLTLIIILFIILFAHYIADFPVQASCKRFMGNKHKSLMHLLNHCMAYGLVLFIFTLPILFWVNVTVSWLFGWAALNAWLHFGIDYFTSRASNKLWNKGVKPDMKTVLVKGWWPLEPRGHQTERRIYEQFISYDQKYIGPFWCVIGFDQFLHTTLLLITAIWFELI